jgi:hypothetical protein
MSEKYKQLESIEIAQRLLTKEQFIGALMFNVIKYSLLNGGEIDENKRNTYSYWLQLARTGVIINPTKDAVPINFIYKGL